MLDTGGQLWYPQVSEPAPLLCLNHMRHGGPKGRRNIFADLHTEYEN